jgi:hypothetical protein
VRISRSLVALPIVLTLGLTLGGPTAVADPPEPPGTKASPAGQDHRAEQAEQALANVQAILDGDASSRGGASTGGDLTMALHELRILKDALSPAQRALAARYYLRPGEGTDPYIPAALPFSTCSVDICVHWTETGNDRPEGSDGNGATIPPYIALVRDTVQQIHDDYLAAGYRDEKGDGAIGGGTDDTDIYIGDIGDGGLYGFCTSDDPNNPNITGDYSAWAYCALDDDYDPSEFPTNTPTENMQVTAAHEYFHATQYAYDSYEDGWILESTATWIEDEMFDGVDDNRNYLSKSPLTNPARSIDRFGGLFHYGVWIWWRYLTEKFTSETGGLPNLVLAVWNRLDGTPGAPDDHSSQGLARVLDSRGSSLKKEFQLFSAANRHPGTVYSEGFAYPASPAALTLALSAARPSKAGQGPIDHLSSATVRFNPRNLSQNNWKLRLSFDLPPTARGAAAVVTVYKRNGSISTSIIRLNRQGGGSKTVPFSSGSIRGVDAVLVNASARFNCWQGSPFSCQGDPRDDDLLFKVVGRAFRS